MTLDWLSRWNLYSPDSIAITDVQTHRDHTYSDLYHQALRGAYFLKSKYQIGRGDRVAVFATNLYEYIPLFFSLQRLGAILVPINFRFTEKEAEHIVVDSGAKLLIYEDTFLNTVKNIPTKLLRINHSSEENSFAGVIYQGPIDNEAYNFWGDWEDPVQILYTSGTTGFPKGAIITHKVLFWNSINTGLRLNLTQSDVTLSFLPLFHTGGWNVLLTPFLHRGARLIFLNKFDANKVLHCCEKFQITILFGVPTTMDMLVHSPAFNETSLSSIRYAIVGGEPMPVPLIEVWQNRGIPIRQGYGLTEFGPNVFSLNEEDAIRKIGSIGFPNFYIEAKVVDESGLECAPDEIGELVLKGPMCMKEYWNQPEATASTIKNGWLYTGDLVRKDSEGYYYVVGRKKEMYISGGENIYPAEIEKVIQSHQLIREVAVIGVPDPKWGEVGKAFFSLEPTETNTETTLNIESFIQTDLIPYCKAKLAKFKVPKYFVQLDELPKGDSGKILKKQLPRNT